ncbi:MAG: InlB B-repeat-containing protein [Candidatus Saccharibacteria bacterium]|nr:InlB B-repeat-containing protein [Candidatus Saccharibacteria bacterium]
MPKINNYQLGSVGLSLAFFGVLFSVTLSAGVVLANSGVRADGGSASSSVTVRVSSACTMSGEDNTYSTALLPGQETADDAMGPSNIKTICNDGDGYSVYAVGYSNDSYTDNNTKMIGTYANIDTGTASSAGANSYWAMKVDAVTGTYEPEIMNDFDSYHEVPADFAQVARLTSATDGGEEAVGSNIQAYYKVKAAASQVAGSYTGKVKYVLVHPNTVVAGNYTIAFNANGGTGTMESQTGLANYEEQTLAAFATGEIVAPTGYRFAGWCSAQDSGASASNPQTTCMGEFYTDEGTIPVGIVSANQTLTLYAVWEVIPKIYMQDLTLSECQAQATDAPLTVYDRRDESDYTVRYISGACWMTQNLRIVGEISATDSNFSSAESFDTMAGGDIKDGGGYRPKVPISHLADDDDIAASASAEGAPYTAEQLGAWYNLCAASAGQVCLDNSVQPIPSATQDICPANWHLPIQDASKPAGSINSLAEKVSNKDLFSPIYGGVYNSKNELSAPTSNGQWWSSSAASGASYYTIRYHDDDQFGYAYGGRLSFYIRCTLTP